MTVCNQNRVNCEELQILIEDCRDNMTICEDEGESNFEILEYLYGFCNATDKSFGGKKPGNETLYIVS